MLNIWVKYLAKYGQILSKIHGQVFLSLLNLFPILLPTVDAPLALYLILLPMNVISLLKFITEHPLNKKK